MQNLKEKNEITASKIKQQSLCFLIMNVGWLKRGDQTNVRVAEANSNNR
jgi:hypothetical protein